MYFNYLSLTQGSDPTYTDIAESFRIFEYDSKSQREHSQIRKCLREQYIQDIFASFAGVPKYLYDLSLKGEALFFFNALSGIF